MEINVSSLKDLKAKLDTEINNYEITLLNLNNSIVDVSNSWQDSNSIRFIDLTASEKQLKDIKLAEIKQISDIYKYLIDSYDSIGNKILFDLDKYDLVMHKFDEYINEINSLIDLYDSLYLPYNISERYQIFDQKNLLVDCRNCLIDAKNDVKDKLDKISEIESETRRKVESVNISIIKDIDINY